MRTAPRASIVGLALALGLVGPACLKDLLGSDDDNTPFMSQGLGEACRVDTECRTGLACDPATLACVIRGGAAAGDACVRSADCGPALQCAGARCVTEGEGSEGASCADLTGCRRGYACVRSAGEVLGTCQLPRGAARPTPGDGGTPTGDASAPDASTGTTQPRDLEQPCADTLDCQAGLICATPANLCRAAVPGQGLPQPWTGGGCNADPVGPVRAYFELPRDDGAPPNDFFRLPFPNDIRRDPETRRLNLRGFPHPGTGLLGFDLVDRYLRAAERDLDGFGTNTVVTFRFSGRIDFDTLRLGESVRLIDLTTGEATRSLRLGANTVGNRYLCGNPVFVDTGAGVPLEPGHTYAAILTTALRDTAGQPVVRDSDFGPLLGATAPSAPAAARAWRAYAPLRAWLGTAGLAPDSVLTAAVFTTQDPRRAVTQLRAAVHAAPMPVARDFVRCAAGVRSPCEETVTGSGRGCPAAPDPAFDEYQGTVEIPRFQQGTRPYRAPGEGALAATPTGTERVCVTVTVPRGAPAPSGGFPVVLYAHGTGGSYRSVVSEGLARTLADIDLGGGTRARLATVGFDGVMHGPRRGEGVTDGPDRLFFNFANPEAARDNVLQGSADVFALVRALVGGVVRLPDGPALDPMRVMFLGHSQGATVGLPAAAVEPDLRASVFSGAGGDLRASLTTKRRPVDIASLTPLVLEDPAAGDTAHPVLNLLQSYFERADAVNLAALLLRARPTGLPLRPVVMTYGPGDTYSTPATMQALAVSLGLPVAGPVPGGAMAWPPGMSLPLPLRDNFPGADGMRVTAALLEADPAGAYDGHFVLFRDATLSRRVAHFLGTAATGTAVVPE
jgi:predicted esterase